MIVKQHNPVRTTIPMQAMMTRFVCSPVCISCPPLNWKGPALFLSTKARKPRKADPEISKDCQENGAARQDRRIQAILRSRFRLWTRHSNGTGSQAIHLGGWRAVLCICTL